MKMQGQAGQPARIQLRNAFFDLVGHFPADDPAPLAEAIGAGPELPALRQFLLALPYHRLTRIQL